MLRKMQLATVLAIAISAGGTIGSVQAGGNGHSGSHHGGGSHHSGGSNFGGFRLGGNSGGNSAPRILQSGSNNVIRSNSLGGIKLGNSGISGNSLPKNTGIVPPVVRIGGTNNGTGIKLPGGSNNNSNKPNLGNILGSNNVVRSSNTLKNISDKMKSPTVQSKVLGGLGIAIGEPNPNRPFPGNGGGNGNGNGNANGNSHHHHGHHHHCLPLVFTLPACQPNYCPPPCPPIYYPQPYPVAVPVPVDANGLPIDPNAVGPAGPVDPNAAPPAGLPMETKQALEAISTDAPPADAAPTSKPEAATTEVVSKEIPLPQIPVGATLTLQGKDLTEKEGQVVLQLGDIALPATIKEWKNDAVTCTLPVLGLTKASKATLHVLRADGKTASTMNCELVTSLPTSIETRPTTTSDIEAAKYEQ